MTNLIIHRGTKEIGGSALELSNNDTKLLFDFGIPLDSMEKDSYKIEDYKLPIQGIYKNEQPEFDAIFLTHAHPDHYGLIQLVHPSIPIYVSKITYDILTKISPLLPKQNTENLNLNIIESEITINNMRIIAHSVDHSAPGASSFEIQTEGKKIVYTGDIRFHGRTSWKSSVFKRKILAPDYLIMEGTTLGRTEQNILKEKDLEEEFVKIFNSDKIPLVQFSAQTLDRFVTVYRACLKTGKTLVIDPYTCYVLEVFSQICENIPQYDWNNIMVYFANNSISKKLAETKVLFKYQSKKVTEKELLDNPQKYVIKGNGIINNKMLKQIDRDKINIVFSMWKGYLDRPNKFKNNKDLITLLHTSGHAYIKDLQKLVDKMQPKNLIPIHTECKDKYKELFNANIIELNDGELLEL